jgi:hypothetical protein
MLDGHEPELGAIDYQSLTRAQQEALKREAIAWAREERSRAVHALISRILFWLKPKSARRARATGVAVAACYEPRHC